MSNKNKKERTRIITANITMIETIPDGKTTKLSKKAEMRIVGDKIKAAFNADDVHVTNLKDFILDK